MLAVGEELLGQVPDVLLRASCPFGGGVGGGHAELCGVLSGAVLLLGARFGRTLPSESDERLFELVRRYREQFMRLAGGSQCECIRNSLPEVEKRCLPIVVEGTRLLLRMLAEFSVEGDRVVANDPASDV